MPKSTTFANDIMALIFNGTAITDLAENDASAPLTYLYVALHATDPGIGGSQLTGETNYTNYLRVAVNRNSGGSGWAVAVGAAINQALIQFATCGVTGATVAFVSIGTASSGAGKVLYSGPVSPTLSVTQGIQPQYSPSTLTATET
jgi:hypothetical protein